MSSVFLFGAGASYGSGPCAPYPPPLGSQFFPALQKQGGIATTVSSELASLFTRDFEAGMDRFWAERNTDTTQLLREMASFFAPFEPLQGNLYKELIKILGGTKKKAVMVTTNYDLLIEHAIAQSDLLVTYGGLPVAANNIPVLKIHGSCNFLPDLQPKQFSGITFDLSQSKGGSIIEAGIKPAKSAREIIEFCEREDSIAPALAIYSPSKQVLFCRGFVQAQQQAWKSNLASASRIYVIGLRVHLVDEHIWGELAKTKAPLYYVGREPSEFLAWAHSTRRKSTYTLAKSFDEALPKIAIHHGYKLKPGRTNA